MINNNDRELKELGSPKDKLVLEREKVFTPGSKGETKGGCSGRCYHTPEAVREPGGAKGGLCSTAEPLLMGRCLEIPSCTSSWKSGGSTLPHERPNLHYAVLGPDDTLRTRLLLEIVFCRLNCPDCRTDQREVGLFPCCTGQGAV